MNVPDDTVSEILLRLPVQSVLRFRCVCKKWFAQINSPLFKKKHLAYRLARYDDELIVVNGTYNFHYDNFCENGRTCYGFAKSVVTCYGDYRSLSCSKSLCSRDIGSIYSSSFSYHINGIVCVALLSGEGFNVFLCNPALREFRKLSKFMMGLPVEFGLTNPIEIRAVGFGFDDATEDYIVVLLLNNKKKDDDDDGDVCTDLKCVLYHVRTDSWTMIEIPAYVSVYASYFKDNPFYSSFFSYGSIHWCMGWEPSYRILTFNTTSKLFQEIQFPHGWKEDYDYREYPHLFKVDNSCIALVGAHDLYTLDTLDIWVMKEYGVTESWTKQYSIRCFQPIQKPLSFWRKDKLLLLTMEMDSKIICYDLSRGRLYKPPGQRDSDSMRLPHGPHPYDMVSEVGRSTVGTP